MTASSARSTSASEARGTGAFVLGDAALVADSSGALWWPELETLVVADLHLEKGASYARRGAFLPPYDSRATLRRLADVMARLQPARMVLLGDSFHDVEVMRHLPEEERAMLVRLQENCVWIWVTGNHDPQICDRLGGEVRTEFVLGDLTFRHEPGPVDVVGEVAGHLHPAARIVRHGRSLRRRCLVGNGDRIVLPAFGAYTGGLNVRDTAFDAVFCKRRAPLSMVWMLGQNDVFGIEARELKGD